MKPRFIVIDGKTYNSVNEMPEDVRLKYEQAMGTLKDQGQDQIPAALGNIFGDKDNNGVPDVFENSINAGTIMNSMKIVVEGKEINSIDDLPPDARAKYDRAMSGLDADKNGIPDFMEGMMGTQRQESTVSSNIESHAARQPIPVSPTITPDTSNGWMLALLGLLLLFVCAAGAVGLWYLFIQ